MTKGKLLENVKKYFNACLIAWDTPERHIEDKPGDAQYFLSEEYKKIVTKDVKKMRSEYKIKFYGNSNTSTSFNLLEGKDEAIIAFRGSDSLTDWIADFSFFKKEFTESLLDRKMSREDIDLNSFEEYCKSSEGYNDIISNSKLTNLFGGIFSKIKNSVANNDSGSGSDEIQMSAFDNDSNNGIFSGFSISKFFMKICNSIKFHGGFLSQLNTVYDTFDMVYTKMCEKYDKVIITGHSLGSALAKLGFIFMSVSHPEYYDKTFCFIYGTPKVGNKPLEDFVAKMINSNNKIIKVNTKHDICNAIPPDNLGFANQKDDLILEPMETPFNSKGGHTLWYYKFLLDNKSKIIFKD